MAEFEDKLREAFDAEQKQTPAPPGLRQRVIANAVATPRAQRRGIGAWLAPPRLVPIGVAAAVLLVAGVAAGIYLRNQTTGPVAVHPTPTPSAKLAFGKLPPPALHPPQGLGAGGGNSTTATPYFGPATMTWSGALPRVAATAPVFHFKLATVADADGFATYLGATQVASDPTSASREYHRSDGYRLFISMTDPVASEPTFILSRDPGSAAPTQPLTDGMARVTADAELAKLRLTPSWQHVVLVSQFTTFGESSPNFVIQYQRVVPIGGGQLAGAVDGNGDPSGIQVMVAPNGQVFDVRGVLRLSEQAGSYPLRAASTVLKDAVNAPPITNDIGPKPIVTLSKVTLVYTVVAFGPDGYLEPAYLFTGEFTQNGGPYEKRVLIPAVAPAALSG